MKSLLESEGVTVLDIAIGGHLAVAGVDQGYYLQVLSEDRVEHAQFFGITISVNTYLWKTVEEYLACQAKPGKPLIAKRHTAIEIGVHDDQQNEYP